MHTVSQSKLTVIINSTTKLRVEMAVQIIKRRTKAIMMDTMLAIERWPEAVDYAVHTHNLVQLYQLPERPSMMEVAYRP